MVTRTDPPDEGAIVSTLSVEKLIEIMRATQGESADTSTLTEEALDTRFTDLSVDSLAVLEVVTQIQDEFQVRVPDAAMEEMETPRQILDYVNGLLEEAA
ncbi:Acyl carrier protein OS=Streptomyces fumanus OX=67302 GN=GCM10018772_33950 PE=4 SV=1 [Streptomyces fumanus]|uniref:Acyl carrier protein n=1 Tax=Streptomyces fumanus TaxID=67302 RepID=A0A919E2Q2_9ACTN|nr:acyl carrier protein [Streptomyces fumanus]